MSKRKSTVEVDVKPNGASVPRFKPKTIGQNEYVKKINNNIVTFCSGPAGTGKSACAIAIACKEYLAGNYDKIMIARPAIEASKKGIGFLPGGLEEKFGPYVKPAILNLKKFLGKEIYETAVKDEHIIFEPLEYMRGMTYDNSFIILEEAQNCTAEQLKMFVTRIGEDSKMVINGDVNQTDLEYHKYTDLEIVVDRVLSNALDGFAYHEMTEQDIVRHRIIGPFLKVVGDL